MLTLFTVSTFEGWPDLLYVSIDSNEVCFSLLLIKARAKRFFLRTPRRTMARFTILDQLSPLTILFISSSLRSLWSTYSSVSSLSRFRTRVSRSTRTVTSTRTKETALSLL